MQTKFWLKTEECMFNVFILQCSVIFLEISGSRKAWRWHTLFNMQKEQWIPYWWTISAMRKHHRVLECKTKKEDYSSSSDEDAFTALLRRKKKRKSINRKDMLWHKTREKGTFEESTFRNWPKQGARPEKHNTKSFSSNPQYPQ